MQRKTPLLLWLVAIVMMAVIGVPALSAAPKLTLPDGRTVGPGLFDWAPVLRGMGTRQLRALLAVIEGKRA